MKIAMESEVGVTEISLINAKSLKERYGKPWRISLVKTRPPEEQYVIAEYSGCFHAFSGFAWGYGGTGPHGLLRFLHDNGVDDITIGDIIKLQDEDLEEFINDRLGAKSWQ